MFRIMLAAGLMTGLLMLGACSSHPGNSGKLKAEMVNGGGDVSGTGKRVCLRKEKTGSHLAHNYCMTPAQYKRYQKDEQESQELWQEKKMNHDNGANGGGGGGSWSWS